MKAPTLSLKNALKVIIPAASLCLFAATTYAASIIEFEAYKIYNPTTYDITSLGAEDWGYWDTADTGLDFAAPTNFKSGGGTIGNVTAIGGETETVRGSGTTDTNAIYSYTDGNSPTSGTTSGVSGIFNSDLNAVGVGVQFAIDLPTNEAYFIYLWTAAYNTTSTLTISLAGSDDYVSTLTQSGVNSTTTFLYKLRVRANTAGDDLNISLVTTDNATYSRAAFAGAAVAVPEPSTYAAFFGGAVLLLFGFRRFRQKQLR